MIQPYVLHYANRMHFKQTGSECSCRRKIIAMYPCGYVLSTFFAGVPKSELSGGIRSSSKLPLVWSAEDLRTHILKTFPRVINFRYMKCNQGKNLEPLPQEICPRDLRDLLGRSGLYIVPIAPLLPKVRQLPIFFDRI